MPIVRIFFGNRTAAAAAAPFNSFAPVPPAPLQRSVAPQVLGSSMALLAAVVVTAPFFNPSNAVAKGLAPAAPDQVYTNVPLLDYQSTPFVQRDWSSPVRVRLSAPDQLHTNIGNFTNPVPFGPFDYQKAAKPAIIPPQLQPALTHLISAVVAAPFYQTDWSKSRYLSTVAPDQAHTDINKFTNPLPFAQLDWSKPSTVAGVPAAPLPLNLSLSIVVQSPFYQTAWPVSVSVKAAAVDQFDRNSLIFSEVPFSQTEWPRARTAAAAALATVAYNPNLLTAVVPAPFVPIDWSRPFAVRGAPAQAQSANVNLFTNPQPFFQTDWSKPARVSSALGAPLPLNANLYSVVAPAAPFAQYDWAPARVAPVRYVQGSMQTNFTVLVADVVVSAPGDDDWITRARRRGRR